MLLLLKNASGRGERRGVIMSCMPVVLRTTETLASLQRRDRARRVLPTRNAFAGEGEQRDERDKKGRCRLIPGLVIRYHAVVTFPD